MDRHARTTATSDDVAANLAVIVTAGGVALTRSPWPGIAVGLLIGVAFSASALHVIRDGRRFPGAPVQLPSGSSV